MRHQGADCDRTAGNGLLTARTYTKQLDVRPEPLRRQLRQFVGPTITPVILLAVASPGACAAAAATGCRCGGRLPRSRAAGFGAADEIHNLAVQVDTVIDCNSMLVSTWYWYGRSGSSFQRRNCSSESLDVRHRNSGAFAADVVEELTCRSTDCARTRTEELLEQLIAKRHPSAPR